MSLLVARYLDSPSCGPRNSEMELADSSSSLQLFDLQINGPHSVVIDDYPLPQDFILRDFGGVMELKLPKQKLPE
jgi:hypothetical protein